jgi:ABC-type uncharacterized transport system YnjBCD permease subunit
VVFVALCFFLLGGVLYLTVISLIVQRWLFEPMQPEQLTPSYWINMGAAAITTLAGARLLSVVGADPLTATLTQLIEAVTVLFCDRGLAIVEFGKGVDKGPWRNPNGR